MICFQPLTVQSFKWQNYLTTPKKGCKKEKIEGVVEDLPCDMITINGVDVQSLQRYLACLACNAEVIKKWGFAQSVICCNPVAGAEQYPVQELFPVHPPEKIKNLRPKSTGRGFQISHAHSQP